jgi:hypothetical protein
MPHSVKARLTLRPGQKGTGKLTKLYGDRLYRVRYRYDEKTKKRFKTVELIAEETGREPPPEPVVPDDPVVGIRVDYEEKDLQNIVRKAGGVWDREKKYGNLHTRMYWLSDCRTELSADYCLNIENLSICRPSWFFDKIV